MDQSRHSDCVPVTSGLPRKADKFKAGRDFAKVPEAGLQPHRRRKLSARKEAKVRLSSAMEAERAF
jgi:hypothetical protein